MDICTAFGIIIHLRIPQACKASTIGVQREVSYLSFGGRLIGLSYFADINDSARTNDGSLSDPDPAAHARHHVGSTFQTDGTKDSDYKFTGQRLDDTTGLYYYGARYYDPQMGRFITPDTIVQAPYDPQTLNRYAYCRNNPIRLTDPTGHISFGEWWSSFKGAVHDLFNSGRD